MSVRQCSLLKTHVIGIRVGFGWAIWKDKNDKGEQKNLTHICLFRSEMVDTIKAATKSAFAAILSRNSLRTVFNNTTTITRQVYLCALTFNGQNYGTDTIKRPKFTIDRPPGSVNECKPKFISYCLRARCTYENFPRTFEIK